MKGCRFQIFRYLPFFYQNTDILNFLLPLFRYSLPTISFIAYIYVHLLLQDKLEASLNEALEKLDGEEHAVSVLNEKFHSAELSIEELTLKGEEMSENISRVSLSVCLSACLSVWRYKHLFPSLENSLYVHF